MLKGLFDCFPFYSVPKLLMALTSLKTPSLLPSLLKFHVSSSSTSRLLSLNCIRLPVQKASFRTTGKMSLDEWKERAPYKVQDNDPNFNARYEGACHCGRVKYQLSREKPLDAKYCHCTTCQKLHGSLLRTFLRDIRSTWLIGNYRCTVPVGCNLSQGRYQFHSWSP